MGQLKDLEIKANSWENDKETEEARRVVNKLKLIDEKNKKKDLISKLLNLLKKILIIQKDKDHETFWHD